MERKVNVLGICGSIRSSLKPQELTNFVLKAHSWETLIELVYKLASDKRISNSEAMMMASMYGALAEGAEIDVITLSYIFRDCVSATDLGFDEILFKISRADAICVSTPVYFGDSSSYVGSLMELLRKRAAQSGNVLDGKVCAFASVGAKRNGGQETTNIYGLYDLLQMEAVVVGNGPPTSQYGGTGWAGDLGAILDDVFGLETSKGIGRRVVQVCNILGQGVYSGPVRVLVLGVCSNGDNISTLLPENIIQGVNIDFVDLARYELARCKGCRVCPAPVESQYKCVIKDGMELLFEKLIKADGIIFVAGRAGWDIFRTFIERTRFIRRDNFRLTNVPVGSLCVGEYGTDALLDLRILSAALRHNTFFVGSSFVAHNGNILKIKSMGDFWNRFIKYASMAKAGRQILKSTEAIYTPIGYKD